MKNKRENNFFWHVTTYDKISSILKYGINQSDDGNLGEGVYCVKEGDIKSLKSVLNLDSFKDNGYDIKDLVLVKFQYSGDYQAFKPIMRLYSNEIWIVIKEDIKQNQIIKVIYNIEKSIIFKDTQYIGR